MNKMTSQPDEKSATLIKSSTERLFETLMEQTADRIYIKDENSRFVAVSQELANLHKYNNRHDLEGLSDFDLFSKEHAQQAYDDEQTILKTGKPMIDKVEKETWPDGSVTWVTSSKAPLYFHGDQLVGIIGISRDITAQKLAQEQLAEREKRLREQNEIMRADYESAKNVQRVMIPGRVPKIKDLKIAYLWNPMTSVGGDILTFPRNPKNSLLFFLGDVCGHGVSAAFFTILLKYFCNHAAESYRTDPQAFLQHINVEIQERIKEGFITGLAGHFSPRTADGSRTLHISHAGHRKILIFRKKDERIEEISLPPGMVLGLPGSEASTIQQITLHVGDRFYAYTDGIAEASAPDGEEFGNKAIIANLEENRNLPIQEGIDALYDTVAAYTKIPTQQDDITIVGIELKE